MKWLKNKITFFNLFIIIGLLLQTFVFIYDNTSVISYISGCFGIIAVVLCSAKKYTQYLFAFPQLLTYLYISFNEQLWGEVSINVFYFIMMIIVMFSWRKGNYNKETKEIEARSLGIIDNIYTFIGAILVTTILAGILKITNDSQPILDALTTGPAVIAQILMVFRYKEQWFYWIVIDILSIIMWINADDICMVMQYVFWTINCIYGYYMWNNKKITL